MIKKHGEYPAERGVLTGKIQNVFFAQNLKEEKKK